MDKKKHISIFSPKEKSLWVRCFMGVLTAAALLAAAALLGFISLYFSTGSYEQELMDFYLTSPKLLLLNIMPFVAVSLLLWFATGRAWLAYLLTSVIGLAYSFAEYWKLMARSEPIFAEELGLVTEAMQMSERYITVTQAMVQTVAIVLILTVLLLVFFRGKVSGALPRVLLTVFMVLTIFIQYRVVYCDDAVYEDMSVWEPLNPWFENSQYISRGGIYPFIYSIQYALDSTPEGYQEQQAQDVLRSYQTNAIPEDKKVTVVCTMLEAFCDLSQYTDQITERDPYEAYHQLQEESYTGNLFTNIFAGGTINTERCVLTGFSELTNLRRTSWSYARYFAEQGYTLNGSHAGNEEFYDRINVNRNLGFDDYFFFENHYNQLCDTIAPDSIFLDEVAEITEQQMQTGSPVFSYNVTYQNHGPYSTSEQYFEEEYVPQGDMPDADYHIVNNYLAGIEDTGNQLAAMADRFRDTEEPVILVFFGDHKPWLGEQSSTYAALGIDMEEHNDEGLYNYYQTEYIIWANDAAKTVLDNDFVGTGETISPCFLMNVLFEQCGWEGPSYQKMTDEIMENIPIVSSNDIFAKDGVLVSERELSEADRKQIQEMRQVQYYLAQDADGKLPE